MKKLTKQVVEAWRVQLEDGHGLSSREGLMLLSHIAALERKLEATTTRGTRPTKEEREIQRLEREIKERDEALEDIEDNWQMDLKTDPDGSRYIEDSFGSTVEEDDAPHLARRLAARDEKVAPPPPQGEERSITQEAAKHRWEERR